MKTDCPRCTDITDFKHTALQAAPLALPGATPNPMNLEASQRAIVQCRESTAASTAWGSLDIPLLYDSRHVTTAAIAEDVNEIIEKAEKAMEERK